MGAVLSKSRVMSKLGELVDDDALIRHVRPDPEPVVHLLEATRAAGRVTAVDRQILRVVRGREQRQRRVQPRPAYRARRRRDQAGDQEPLLLVEGRGIRFLLVAPITPGLSQPVSRHVFIDLPRQRAESTRRMLDDACFRGDLFLRFLQRQRDRLRAVGALSGILVNELGDQGIEPDGTVHHDGGDTLQAVVRIVDHDAGVVAAVHEGRQGRVDGPDVPDAALDASTDETAPARVDVGSSPKLGPPPVGMGRVVDMDGNPIQGARVRFGRCVPYGSFPVSIS